MKHPDVLLIFLAGLMTAGSGCSNITSASSLSAGAGPYLSVQGAVAVAAVAYVVMDPLAPNWQIEETKLGNGQYRLSMRMKRFAGGGTGEARQSFRRRATQLAHEGGYGGYQIVSFSEGVEFDYLSPQRVSEGVIELIAKNSN